MLLVFFRRQPGILLEKWVMWMFMLRDSLKLMRWSILLAIYILLILFNSTSTETSEIMHLQSRRNQPRVHHFLIHLRGILSLKLIRLLVNYMSGRAIGDFVVLRETPSVLPKIGTFNWLLICSNSISLWLSTTDLIMCILSQILPMLSPLKPRVSRPPRFWLERQHLPFHVHPLLL